VTATTLSRRRFLGTTLAAGTAAALVPRVAWATPTEPATGDTIVWLFLRGGMDGLSMVVPYEDGRYYDRRPTIAVPGPNADRLQGALPLGNGFGLHPAMAALYDGPWTAGRMAVVHAVGLTGQSRSHFESMRFWEGGRVGPTSHDSGWLNRYLQAVGATGLVPGVSRDRALTHSLYGHPEALAFADVAAFGIDLFPSAHRANVATALGGLYDAAGGPLGTSAAHAVDVFGGVRAANPLSQPVNATYPNTASGTLFRQTAQLIKSGLGIRAVALNDSNWDHHVNQGNHTSGSFHGRATTVATNLAAFVADLGPLMSEVTILVVSEFGRTVSENGSAGTDHGLGSCVLVIGGSVVGGLHGLDRWPGVVSHPTLRDLPITTDIRSIVCEVIRKRSDHPGLDLGAVFPGWNHDPATELGLVT
jgi:uncharacterized protein (DUF1501 family)